jgi:transcriptional regulator with XRE-family HTH domain
LRVVCYLRTIRANQTLTALAAESGISAGVLSMIERGYTFPTDEQADRLEHVYGRPRTDWYDRDVLLALQADEAQT